MICPLCKVDLEKSLFNNLEIDYCPKCLGIWFEQDELRLAKDERDKNLKWLDIDLWEKEVEFHIASGQKLCPFCRLPLYEVAYNKSQVKVDVCNICHGIWLDRGEFKKIIDYLHQKADAELLRNFAKNAVEELFEIFIGPESLREEIEDFIILLKLFAYKFLSQHPLIAKLISQFPR